MTLDDLEMKILALRESSRGAMLGFEGPALRGNLGAKELYDYHEGRLVLADEILEIIREAREPRAPQRMSLHEARPQ
jgi:hypothetical protein